MSAFCGQRCLALGRECAPTALLKLSFMHVRLLFDADCDAAVGAAAAAAKGKQRLTVISMRSKSAAVGC